MTQEANSSVAFRGRIADLRLRVSQVRELRDAERRVGTYERAAAQLGEATARLAPLASAFRAMLDKGIISAELRGFGRELAEEVRATLQDGRAKVAAGSEIESFQANVVKTKTLKLADAVERALREAWRRWGLDLIPPLDDDVLAVLEQVGRAPDVQRMRRSNVSLRDRIERLPETDAAITAFERDVADLARAIQDMPIPGQVRAFLLAAPGGAHLDLLTDEVRRWIRENGLQASFVVLPRRRQA